jgi:hypothetical protein
MAFDLNSPGKMAVEGKMKRILNILLLSICCFIIMACAAQQTGDTRLQDIARFRTGMAYGLSIKDGYAYITTNSDLIIIDISDPKKPRRVGALKLGAPCFAVKVVGQKAFLAATDKGLVIVDVSDPKNPVIIGEFHDGGVVRRVGIVDNYCITSDFENGLNILDISDPAKPVKIGNLKFDRIKQFVATNELVYIVDIGKGLKIADISDKTNPVELSTVEETQEAACVAVDGKRLFLGFFDGSIKIFDIADPKSPELLTEMNCPGEVLGLVAADNYLFINYKGVIVKDITDLNAIVDVGHYRRTKGAHGIVYQDRYVYYVKNGLTIFKIVKF